MLTFDGLDVREWVAPLFHFEEQDLEALLKTTDIIQGLVQGKVEELGYELVDVEFKKEQSDWILTLYIDRQSGIGLDDCEKVSRAVEPVLDEKDPIPHTYFLSVSSPGLDRPLKSERDYRRNIGKPVVVKLYVKTDGKKEFIGVLKDFDGERLVLAFKDKKERVFQIKDIALVKPHIEF